MPVRVVPIRFCSRRGLPCRVRYRPRGALLPHLFTLTPGKPEAVRFLWHFPWGRPRRTLSGAVFPWSPDFPPPKPFLTKASGAAARPTGRGYMRRGAGGVNHWSLSLRLFTCSGRVSQHFLLLICQQQERFQHNHRVVLLLSKSPSAKTNGLFIIHTGDAGS